MTPFDSRLSLLADEAKVRPSHLFHVIAALSDPAFNPATFAAFARLELIHVERMLAALQSHDMMPKRRRAVATQAHATRLPALMQLPDDWLSYAQQKRQWTKAQTEDVLADFIEYWSNRNDQKAAKLDWTLTWQAWVRRDRRPDGIAVPTRTTDDPELLWLTKERARLSASPRYDEGAETAWQARRTAYYGR